MGQFEVLFDGDQTSFSAADFEISGIPTSGFQSLGFER
jgi:hypothetical protein